MSINRNVKRNSSVGFSKRDQSMFWLKCDTIVNHLNLNIQFQQESLIYLDYCVSDR